MVTSSAVVGSSAMISFGLQASADGDHHALAHAAGELVRILLEPALAVGDADQLEQLDRARSRRRARQRRDGCCSGSVICRPIVSTGLSEVIGSWKIMRDVAAADLAHLLVGQRQQVAAVEQDLARRRSGPADRGSGA